MCIGGGKENCHLSVTLIIEHLPQMSRCDVGGLLSERDAIDAWVVHARKQIIRS